MAWLTDDFGSGDPDLPLTPDSMAIQARQDRETAAANARQRAKWTAAEAHRVANLDPARRALLSAAWDRRTYEGKDAQRKVSRDMDAKDTYFVVRGMPRDEAKERMIVELLDVWDDLVPDNEFAEVIAEMVSAAIP